MPALRVVRGLDAGEHRPAAEQPLGVRGPRGDRGDLRLRAGDADGVLEPAAPSPSSRPATSGASIRCVGTALPVCSTSVRTSPLRARISLAATIAAITSRPDARPSSPAASAAGTIVAPECAMNVQSSHSSTWA